MLARRADERPTGPETIFNRRRAVAVTAAVRWRVQVEMRLEGGKEIGGTGSPDDEGANAVGLVIAVESAPLEVLFGEGACRATAIATARASTGPVSPSEGTAKTEVNALSALGTIAPRPGP